MSSLDNAANAYADDARAEIAALRAKVDALMESRVTPALNAMAQEAGTLAHDASEGIKAQAGRLTDGIKEQPVMALGIAAALGFMLATLVRR